MGHDTDIRNALSTVAVSFNTVADTIYSEDMPGAYQAYTQVVPSGGLRTYRIDFGGATPVAREWLGSKVEKQFRLYSHTLTLKKWEATIGIDRMEYQYDNAAGIVSGKVGEFLAKTAYTYDARAYAALIANGTGYDGVSLFNASHPHGNTTNSNTGTTALSKTAVDSTLKIMAKWQNEYGEPVGVRPTTLYCGPDLESTAKEILETGDRVLGIDTDAAEATEFAIAAATKQNIYQGILKLVVDPRLADGTRNNYWYLFDESKAQKPIILVEGRKPTPVKQDSLESDRRYWLDRFSYSVEFDAVAGPGFWYTAYRHVV